MGKTSRKKRQLREGRSISLPPEMMDILRHRLHEQEAELGRPPGPKDLVFPEASDKAPLDKGMVAGLLRLGARADVLAAFGEVGRVVLPRTRQTLDGNDVAEWDDALEAYRRAHPDEERTDLDELQSAFDAELNTTAARLRPQRRCRSWRARD